ncbi:Gamma-glutamyl cyclotransferase aclK (GGCT aclK) (Aspirochlorine biosynthesis protein K) [Durusdinium trenchii]|uniref:gamma-glutamylcyclotransferase n=1 Tax=Durusdinium trenchii TaxID=1381693 RepID=A0ABP0HEI2_9DINO
MMRSVRRWHVQPGVHAFALLVGVLLGRNAPTMVEPLSRGSDRAWNFAFGSNMVPSTRQRRRLEPSRTVPAVVQGWELHFSLPGIPYIEPAFAALRPSNVSTHGVCLELDKENWLRLLVSEGVFRPDEANAMKRASLQEVLELAAKPTATFGYRLLPLQACSYGRSAAGAASPGTGPGLVAYAFVDAQLEGAPPLLPPSRRYWGLLRAGARQHGLDRSYRDYLYSLPRYVPSPLSAAALPTVLSASAAKGLEGLVEASRAGRLVDLAARDPRGEAWPTLDGLAFLGTGTLVIGPDCADPSSGLVEVLHNIQRNLVELHARAGGRGVSNHLHCMS